MEAKTVSLSRLRDRKIDCTFDEILDVKRRTHCGVWVLNSPGLTNMVCGLVGFSDMVARRC